MCYNRWRNEVTRLEPRKPWRQLEQRGRELPVGEPEQEYAGEPEQQPGFSCGPSSARWWIPKATEPISVPSDQG